MGWAALLILFAVLTGWFPSAGATHWCDSVQVTTNPSTVFAADRVDFGVTLTNGFASQVNANLRLRFGWESQTLNWGSAQLSVGASRTQSYSKIITQDPADYAVAITLMGEALDGNPEGSTTCPTLGRTLRVEPLPPAPAVVAGATPTTGLAPLNVSFSARTSGGFPPLVFHWAFGDGATSSSNATRHAYADAGVFVAQVTVTDARGRLAVDRIQVHVVEAAAATRQGGDLADPAQAPRPGFGFAQGRPVFEWFVLVGVAVLVAMQWAANRRLQQAVRGFQPVDSGSDASGKDATKPASTPSDTDAATPAPAGEGGVRPPAQDAELRQPPSKDPSPGNAETGAADPSSSRKEPPTDDAGRPDAGHRDEQAPVAENQPAQPNTT